MFKCEKYITRGINDSVGIDLQLYMWELIGELKNKKDFSVDSLQVFELKVVTVDDIRFQVIEHRQEIEPYKKKHRIFPIEPVNAKVFVIEDGEYSSTMLLAEEY